MVSMEWVAHSLLGAIALGIILLSSTAVQKRKRPLRGRQARQQWLQAQQPLPPPAPIRRLLNRLRKYLRKAWSNTQLGALVSSDRLS